MAVDMNKKHRTVLLALFLFSPLLASAENLAELSSYQKVDRLWMGLAEGIIEPKALETVQAPIEGYYLFEARDGDWLKKEQHWLTIEPNKLELEKQELELEGQKLKEAERLAELEEVEELQRLEEQLEEIEEQQRLLLAAVSNQEESEFLPQNLGERVRKAFEKLDVEAERIRDLTSTETREATKTLTKKEQALQLERKRLTLIATEKRSKIKAPFDGMLTLSNEVKEQLLKPGETSGLIWLRPGTAIGLIADRRSYLVRVPSEGTVLDTIPEEDVKILITNREEGKLVMANFLQINQEQIGTQTSEIFEFEITKEDAQDLTVASQKKIIANIFRTFKEPCRVIPKRDIAFEDSAILQSGGWKLLVNKLYPEAELIAVGPQHLAVRKKER